MAPLPLYSVHARGYTPDFTDTHTVIFHQIIETGGSTLAEVAYRAVKRLGGAFRNAQELREDRSLRRELGPALGLIYGHDAYGLHRYTRRPTRYVTMLRDPVEAYVSRFYNWSFVSPEAVRGRSLEEYVEAEERGNHQARDLARCLEDDAELDYELDDAELLDRARRVLDERFVFCGITELFEETIFMLAAMFGWGQVNMWHRRLATPGRPAVATLPHDLVARIESLVEVDRQLYASESSRLLQLVKEADFDKGFTRYKADALATDAESFARATAQKYEMLIEQLRGELADKDRQIQEQAIALARSRELLQRAQSLIGSEASLVQA